MADAGPQSVSGFNIEAFRSNLARRGVMSTNLFQAYFPPPPGMTNRGSQQTFYEVAREMNMWCESAIIPGVDWKTATIYRFGYGTDEQVAVSPSFTPVPLTFICDADGRDWHFFREWNMLVGNFNNENGVTAGSGNMGGNSSSSYEMGYLEDYATNVAISTFTDEGIERMRIILNEAFPVVVSPIRVGWGLNGQSSIARFTAVMQYRDWHHDYSNPSVTLDGISTPAQNLIRNSPQITPQTPVIA